MLKSGAVCAGRLADVVPLMGALGVPDVPGVPTDCAQVKGSSEIQKIK